MKTRNACLYLKYQSKQMWQLLQEQQLQMSKRYSLVEYRCYPALLPDRIIWQTISLANRRLTDCWKSKIVGGAYTLRNLFERHRRNLIHWVFFFLPCETKRIVTFDKLRKYCGNKLKSFNRYSVISCAVPLPSNLLIHSMILLLRVQIIMSQPGNIGHDTVGGNNDLISRQLCCT